MRDVEYNAVTAGAVRSLRLRLLRGRLIDENDTERSVPVAFVTQAFARENFPSSDPIGQRLAIAYGANPPWGREIVGIVADFKMESLAEPPLAQVIVPFYQDVSPTFQIVGRSRAPHAELAKETSAAIRSIDPELPPRGIASYSDYLSDRLSGASTATFLLGFMALVALFLAILGTYGVMSYAVRTQMQEFGIRRALGASGVAIVASVLGRALALGAIAIAFGVALSVAGSQALSKMLYEVSPLDPLTFIVVAATLLLAALGSALPPAIRAMQTDPATILRHE
jgi:hypothetical protein